MSSEPGQDLATEAKEVLEGSGSQDSTLSPEAASEGNNEDESVVTPICGSDDGNDEVHNINKLDNPKAMDVEADQDTLVSAMSH